MTETPQLLAPHYHGDGRRAMFRYVNIGHGDGDPIRQVYTVDIRPGVTTAWHGHERQYDFWVVLEGMLQVGAAEFDAPRERRSIKEYWLNGAHQQVLVIPPRWWHGYHNPGPGLVRMINMTSEAYDPDAPDELRRDPEHFGPFWGEIKMG